MCRESTYCAKPTKSKASQRECVVAKNYKREKIMYWKTREHNWHSSGPLLLFRNTARSEILHAAALREMLERQKKHY